MTNAKTRCSFAVIVLLCLSSWFPAQEPVRPAKAEEKLAAALAAAKTAEERAALLASEKELLNAELARALTLVGNRERVQGNYAQAIALYELSKRIAEQIGDRSGIARGLNRIGIVHYVQGRLAQALELYRQGLALSEEAGDQAEAARTLNNIGLVYKAQGDYPQALEAYRKSLALNEAVADKANMANALNNAGVVYSLQGDYAQALESYRQSLALSEALGDKTATSNALTNLGLIYKEQGDYPRAQEYFAKSLALGQAADNKALVSAALNNMGNAYQEQGDYARALEHHQQGLALAQSLNNRAFTSTFLNHIGQIHEEQGSYAQALEYYQQALALQEAMGQKAEAANTLNNIGVVYKEQGDYARALEYLRKSLALKEAAGSGSEIPTTLIDLGEVHRAQGDYTQALAYYQQGLTRFEAMQKKPGMAVSLKSIGQVYQAQGSYAKALECADRAATLARQTGSREHLWQARALAGRAYHALNQPAASRQALAEAIATIEALRADVAGGEQEQQRFFENKVSPYQAMVELLLAQNNPREAFAYAERAKARVLLDVLSRGRVNITKAMTASEQAQEQRAQNDLVSLNTQLSRESLRPQPDAARLSDLRTRLQKARLDYEAWQTNLYAAHPELKVHRGEALPLTVEQARDLLPDAESALAEFMVMEAKTYLFVLTRKTPTSQTAAELKVYPLEIKQKELAGLAARFRQQLATRDPDFRESAGHLYHRLLEPAWEQLQGKTKLIIVPDGALWELPFQALRTAADRYLLEECAISYAPSLAVLREMVRARRPANSGSAAPTLLAMGNPALGQQTIERVKLARRDEKLDPLPEAEKEVKTLEQVYGETRSKVYVGAEAREDRVKAEAGQFSILHLATHGILDDTSPMYSHVVLSQAGASASDDGLLEAWEMMGLDLKADLVVLSACETARGRVGAGEGVIGLTWALFVAGAPTTVVSQWKVDSASTTELMLEFHRHLKARGAQPKAPITKAGALREAALRVLRQEQYRHPFYWAGFVVVGGGF